LRPTLPVLPAIAVALLGLLWPAAARPMSSADCVPDRRTPRTLIVSLDGVEVVPEEIDVEALYERGYMKK